MLKQIKIHNHSFTHVTRERDPEDQWSSESTDIDNHITGFSLATGNEYHDFVTDVCVIPNRSYTLLYAIYGTGDSFSHHGGQIDYIGLYDTEDNADVVQENIRKLREATGYSVIITAENGEPYTYGIPWNGYFECLEEIESVEIKEKCDI